MTAFVHIRDETNTGDMASCPADYFEFPGARVLNYSDPVPDGPVVYGGGTMVNWLRQQADLPKGPKIIWGAGSSRHGETEPWPDPEGFDLVGTREWTPQREAEGKWAPCVSCMSPLFDREYEITREAVAFVNANDTIRSRYPAAYKTGLPTMENTRPMSEVVAFLGSAEMVVTNSYHGLIWSLWLGRNTSAMGYSSKFCRINPSLTASREATMRFAERVRELIG